nr:MULTISPECIES: hypothetical protein [Burkholderia]
MRDFGEIFCYPARDCFAWARSARSSAIPERPLRKEPEQALMRDSGRHGPAALGTVNTIARGARAVAPQDPRRAATASTGRSETAFASSDP